MNSAFRPAFAGVLTAVLITAAMDATGYAMFSALPLIVLTGLFWFLQKFSRQEIGLTWGDPTSHGWAIAYPLVVLGIVAAIATISGAIDISSTDWNKTLSNIGLMSSTGVLMVLITEEGFFRGWLWASLKRAGKSDKAVLLWTTFAFMIWHISAISLDTGFNLPAREIPIYLINGTISRVSSGASLRMVSGSVLVPAVSHAIWNGINYPVVRLRRENWRSRHPRKPTLCGPEVRAARNPPQQRRVPGPSQSPDTRHHEPRKISAAISLTCNFRGLYCPQLE